jgi:DNA-binding FrmR family transcriptional regulator
MRSIIEMIETQRPYLDVAQQLYAVEKTIAQAKMLIHDHIENCLEQAVGPLARAQRGQSMNSRRLQSTSERCRPWARSPNCSNRAGSWLGAAAERPSARRVARLGAGTQ